MKTKLKSLLLVSVLVPFLFSCGGNEESNGNARIRFDEGSSKDPHATNFAVTGDVKSNEGTTIDYIDVYVEYVEGEQTNSHQLLSMKDLNKVANNEYTFRITSLGDYVDRATAIRIDANVKGGDKSSLKWTLTSTPETTPLEAAKDFEWKREGGAAATGLDMFGLEWINNTGAVAIVKKNNAVKLVNLGSAWATILTKEALTAAITEGTDMADYREISVSASKNYNTTLGVRYNEVDYFLHITRGAVTTGTAGTIVTVTGQYKK